MDYSEWTVRQLQDECRARGLPTARAKADMAARLTQHDAQAGGDEPAAAPEPAEDAPQAAVVRAFRMDFPAEPDGPDEETHLAYRQTTVQAAIDAGHIVRDGGRRVGRVGGREVYEVIVRAPS